MIQFFNSWIRAIKLRCHNFRGPAFSLPRLSPARRLDSVRGQIAIVLILIIAIGLIFYAVVLNLGRVSGSKTITMIATNSAVTQMASYYASYGQKLFKEQLDGHRKVCGWTALFSALILIAIIIIIIIIVIVTWGAGAAIVVPLLGVAVPIVVVLGVALAFAIVAAVLQAVLVNPSITAMWNKMIAESLTIQDQFVERGLQTALQTVVTDQVQIPDVVDLDSDAIYGWGTDPGNPGAPKSVWPDPAQGFSLDNPLQGANDFVSRFAFYNTERLRNVVRPGVANVDEFIAGLKNFLEKADDPADWGLWHPFDCSAPHACCPQNSSPGQNTDMPAECDSCCLPDPMVNPSCGAVAPACCSLPTADPSYCGVCAEEGLQDPQCCCGIAWGATEACVGLPLPVPSCQRIKVRPDCCDLPAGDADKCGDPTTCSQRTPYAPPVPNPAMTYPWIYDRYYERTDDTIWSFREQLGRDDDIHTYLKNIPGTTTCPVTGLDNSDRHGCQEVATFLGTYQSEPRGFIISDVSGFYNPFDYPAGFNPLDPPAEGADDRAGPIGAPDLPVASTLFPFLYKAQDWEFTLSELTYNEASDVVTNPDNRIKQCFWCDQRGYPNPVAGAVCPAPPGPVLDPNELQRLVLPLNPIDAVLNLQFSGGWCVDNANKAGAAAGDPPVLLDLVNDAALAPLFADFNNCAQTTGGWKRGADRYCTTQIVGGAPRFPYGSGCSKHGGLQQCNEWDWDDTNGDGIQDAGELIPVPVDCACGEPGALGGNAWPDDRLDDLVYGLDEFMDWAKGFVTLTPAALAGSIEVWYEDAAYWVEPNYCPGGNNPCPQSFTRNANTADRDWGILYTWRDTLVNTCQPIKNWVSLDSPNGWDPANPDDAIRVNKYVLQSCNLSAGRDSAWCPAYDTQGLGGPCNCSPTWEQATIDFNNNGVRGDVADVVECLRVNTDAGGLAPKNVDFPTSGVPVTVTLEGNALRFQNCFDVCKDPVSTDPDKITACGDLPRSPLPNTCNPGAGGFQNFDVTKCSNGAFLANLTDSVKESVNLVAKMKKRYEFLSRRLQEAESLIGTDYHRACKVSSFGGVDQTGILTRAIQEFTRFLDDNDTATDDTDPLYDPLVDPFHDPGPMDPGDPRTITAPAEKLVKARQDYGNIGDAVLPTVAIYAWRDEIKDARVDWPWHIVKVDVRAPFRCNYECGPGAGRDPGWPRVRTYTKSWGLERCYELVNTEGRVKARAIRFDEDQSTGRLLKFPGGMPLWMFRFAHPDRGSKDASLLVAEGGQGACFEQVHESLISQQGYGLNPVPKTPYPYGYAFMLNRRPDLTPIDQQERDYRDCWQEVHDYLDLGVSTVSCAEYYYANRGIGVSIKFVDCEDRFKRLLN
ncbi:MAG: hypothetical protein Q8Q08_00380 [Candidatus Omnitrophota bacterium]|nr:hypothetical protein [Candidatus Omnitrophota bacterium]MDZ4241958.1 hypothetical protein [Candidatus Omnitrophota bacterium]